MMTASVVDVYAERLAACEQRNPMLAWVRRTWDVAETPRREQWLNICALSKAETLTFAGVDFVNLPETLWFALCGAFMQENYGTFQLMMARGWV